MTLSTEGPRLSSREAAHYLGVSESTLNKWRMVEGGPPFHKILKRVTYSKSDLDTFLAATRRRSTSDSGAPAAA